MLDNSITKQIEDLVYSKPRSIHEIAQHLNKSWRTADRYVEEIIQEYGTLSSRTFRSGTKGALKIVYWASMEKRSSSIFQDCLESQIFSERKKEDFSAFDIFQLVPDKNKKACMLEKDSEDLKDFAEIIESTKKQLLIFSGNLSFTNLKTENKDFLQIFDSLIKTGVSIKIICRIDIVGKENIEQVLALNHKYGKELIEIHHREQPVRAVISDNKILRIKEIKLPTGKDHELDKKLFIYYTITDAEWINWLNKIFWKMFSISIDANKRIEEIKKLR